MQHVFYSWQMSTPTAINRYLIRDSLELAVKDLKRAVMIDEATRGVAGSPDIFATILSKIDRCGAFVADLTLSPLADGGFTCNHNVLIEYGYALAKKSDKRVIPVVNTYFGAIDELPFDLRHKAVRVSYQLAPDASRDDIKRVRQNVAGLLRSELRLIFEDPASVLQLSEAELTVARYLLQVNENGRGGDYRDQEEVAIATGLDLSSTKRAIAELASRRYLERLPVAGTDAPPVAATVDLFWDLDLYVVGWDPRADARLIAEALVESSETGYGSLSSRQFLEQSGWPLRRLNPALEFLTWNGIAGESQNVDPDLVTLEIMENERTRAFLRGSFDPDRQPAR